MNERPKRTQANHSKSIMYQVLNVATKYHKTNIYLALFQQVTHVPLIPVLTEETVRETVAMILPVLAMELAMVG